jgi:hypothetical protein
MPSVVVHHRKRNRHGHRRHGKIDPSPSFEDDSGTLPLDESQGSGMTHLISPHNNSHNTVMSILKTSSSSVSSVRNSFSSDVTPTNTTTTLSGSHILPSSTSASKVHFGMVEVYCHAYTLGDNPSVAGGVPVTIDWKAHESFHIDLEQYEQYKPEPRSQKAMVLPASVRSTILRNHGFSRGEIKEATEQVDHIRKQREQSSRDGRFIRTFVKWYKKLVVLPGSSKDKGTGNNTITNSSIPVDEIIVD